MHIPYPKCLASPACFSERLWGILGFGGRAAPKSGQSASTLAIAEGTCRPLTLCEALCSVDCTVHCTSSQLPQLPLHLLQPLTNSLHLPSLLRSPTGLPEASASPCLSALHSGALHHGFHCTLHPYTPVHDRLASLTWLLLPLTLPQTCQVALLVLLSPQILSQKLTIRPSLGSKVTSLHVLIALAIS